MTKTCHTLKVAPRRKKKHTPSTILDLVTQIINDKREGVEHGIKQYHYQIHGLSLQKFAQLMHDKVGSQWGKFVLWFMS